MKLENLFDSIGHFNYHNRMVVLIASLSVSLFFAVGLFNLRLETDPEKLWVSEESIGYQQEQDFNRQYGAFFRTEQIILAQDELQEANIFDHDHLKTFYFLLSLINKKSVTFEDR